MREAFIILYAYIFRKAMHKIFFFIKNLNLVGMFSYFSIFVAVLELSEKYQKRFGHLRYFVAGILKFLCLPKYSFEVEYLPESKEET